MRGLAAGVDRNGRARAKRQARAVANTLILRRMPARYPFFILRSAFLSVDAFLGVFVYPVDDSFGQCFPGR